MRRIQGFSIVVFLLLLPGVASAQRGGSRGGDAPSPPPRMAPPEMPGSELNEPFAVADFQQVFKLNETQANTYRALRDSFVTATQADRDSVRAAMGLVRAASRSRDQDAEKQQRTHMMAVDRSLKKAQQQFDDRMKTLLTKEQAADYKEFRKKQEEVAKSPRQRG